VGRGDPAQLTLLQQIDRAPVGDGRHREPRHGRERLRVVHGSAELLGGAGQERAAVGVGGEDAVHIATLHTPVGGARALRPFAQP